MIVDTVFAFEKIEKVVEIAVHTLFPSPTMFLEVYSLWALTAGLFDHSLNVVFISQLLQHQYHRQPHSHCVSIHKFLS